MNLPETWTIVFNIFKELAQEYHQSLLTVTHYFDFAAKTQRTITMEDGKIIGTDSALRDIAIN